MRAETLLGRLPQVVAVVERRERVLYGSGDDAIADVVQHFRDFVGVCGLIQESTTQPVTVGVSY